MNLPTKNLTEEKKVNISNLLADNIPFSVIKYFEWFVMRPGEKKTKYEIIYLDKFKNVSSIILDINEKEYFLKNTSLFELVQCSKDGSVWDFNNFKNYQKLNKLNWFLIRSVTPLKGHTYICRDHYEMHELEWNGSHFIDISTGIKNNSVTHIVLDHVYITDVKIKLTEVIKDIRTTPSTSELERILPQLEKIKLIIVSEKKSSKEIPLKGLKETRIKTVKERSYKPRKPITIDAYGSKPKLIIPEELEIDTEFFNYHFHITVISAPLKLKFNKIDLEKLIKSNTATKPAV